MSREAKVAVDNTIALEVKKDGLQQRQNGDWVLRLTAQAIDMHQVIVNAAMGTRFWCSLIQLDDDETPVDHKAKERSEWRDLGATKQSALRCKQPPFWAFMREVWERDEVKNEATCAEAVRDYCEVSSRADLDKSEFALAAIRWHRLDNAYEAWKASEHG